MFDQFKYGQKEFTGLDFLMDICLTQQKLTNLMELTMKEH